MSSGQRLSSAIASSGPRWTSGTKKRVGSGGGSGSGATACCRLERDGGALADNRLELLLRLRSRFRRMPRTVGPSGTFSTPRREAD